MKIAQVAPLYELVPPRLYGGTERIVAHLTDALVELGHDVTLFASADAREARFGPRPGPPGSTRTRGNLTGPPICPCCRSSSQGRRRRRHPLPRRSNPLSLLRAPGAQDRDYASRPAGLKDLPEAYARWPQYPLVSISSDQRRPLPAANCGSGPSSTGCPTTCSAPWLSPKATITTEVGIDAFAAQTRHIRAWVFHAWE